MPKRALPGVPGVPETMGSAMKGGARRSGRSASAAQKRNSPSRAAALRIAVVIENDDWHTEVPAIPGLLRKAARRAMTQARADGWRGSSKAHELCIVLSDDRHVRQLNRDYRGKDKPTNVLSFAALDAGKPDADMPWHLGDVILALGVVRKEATKQRKALNDHLTHLVIHGVLHLLGYDHEEDAEAERMEALEIAALQRLGIGNPYCRAD
ncbi:rRNA maturation RNase YbeY [Dongia soli]|uniref:Endoribonuclease YbeY n=1 Tax=Dongia soli TaxID=600628 RepID=A0ABU5E796_9PROT|nr:rRNA maturation RNase YbeY [Dongia soli]MDY0882182.1 rRNA maturation RNase YbeY [Dongia soli]